MKTARIPILIIVTILTATIIACGGGGGGGGDTENNPGNLTGQIIDQDTGLPLDKVEVTIGEKTTYTDEDGNYEITDIIPPGNYLFTATANKHQDYSKRIMVTEGENTKSLSLISSGDYDGNAPIEYEITITEPETGYAHIKGRFKEGVYQGGTIIMDMHYVHDDNIKIENMAVVNESGTPLSFELHRSHEQFWYYKLIIDAGQSEEIVYEYDIHYETICFNGDPSCIHAYISDSYAVFENMNHILFIGASGYYPNETVTAVRFNLPRGWVRVVPWEQFGDYFVEDIDDIIYSAPGIGRLELHRDKVGGVDVTIGIHERASEFAIEPGWPATIENVMKGVRAANSVAPFDSNHAITIGIPPLGTNEGGINTAYTMADNFPWSFATWGGMDDIRWYEGRWIHYGAGEYLGGIILCESGAWEHETLKNLLVEIKNTYIDEIYRTETDLSIPDLEGLSDSKYSNAKYIKYTLFTYFLDYQIREATGNTQSITDALVCWRDNLPIDFTNDDMLQALNTCIGHDFTDFYDKYFYGTIRYPIELDWYYGED